MNYFSRKYYNMGKIVVLFTIFISIASVHAQHSWYTLPNGQKMELDKTGSTIQTIVSKDGTIQSIHKENPDEIVRLIVTFKAPPLSVYRAKKSSLQKTSLSSVYASLQSDHTNFRSSLNKIKQQLSVQLKSDYNYKIRRDYYRSLNGVALECKRGMVNRIKALPAVKNVSLDQEVKVNLTQSVHQIRADIVQDSLGYKGNGVLVGDVDTGIDYNNPALGGGFGPGFRVIGGFDFANNDNDPMDDFGHGTHVAGIIGANGGDSLRGVAPEVEFLAVKVLDSGGSGWASDIIAGIDYCLDYDGNPETDDAVDIINMSLGASVTYALFDSAVNNAAKAGVLSVVAAGNEGESGYGTVGSPGTSESALTVGACDSVNKIAAFSSRGPEPVYSFIKPDVVAPGVKILSTILNNETASWSGTSMAAPHVTGIAALLKQKYPGWSPEEIKAAIVNSAHSVGEEVSPYIQGKGIVDALDAASTGLIVEPGILSFGRADLSVDTWSDTINIKVKNFRNVAQNVQLNILDAALGGASLTFDKTSLSLEPLEETSVTAILTVPSSVPVAATEPYAYNGKIEVVSDSDNVVVPLSFIKSTTLIVSLDTQPNSIYTVDRVTIDIKPIAVQPGKTKYVLPVRPENPLYIYVTMSQADSLNPEITNNYFVLRKIDNPTGITYAFISREEATISMLDTTIYDAHNEIIRVDSSEAFVECRSYFTGGGALRLGWIVLTQHYSRLYFCPLEPEFFIAKQKIQAHGNEIYVLERYMNGIQNQQDALFPSGPDNLAGFNFSGIYHNPFVKDIPEKYFYVVYNIRDQNTNSETGIDFSFCNGKLYSNKQKPENRPNVRTSTFLGVSHDTAEIGISMPMLRTPEFTVNKNNEAVFENMSLSKYSWDPPVPSKLSTEFIVETLKEGDTIKVEDNRHLSFPNFTTYLEGNSLYMTKHNDIVFHNNLYVFRDGDGGTISSNGLSEEAFVEMPSWNLPRFTVQTYSHNKLQTNEKPYQLWDNNQTWNPSDYLYAYYVFDNIKENAGLYRIMGNTYPYTILGQSGQCTVDYEYRTPDIDEWPENSTYYLSNRIIFPSFSFLQVSVDGEAENIVQPGQNGTIRLVLFDPDSTAISVKLSLLLASGDEINLPLSYHGKNEYNASIPDYIPKGFVDVVARFEDTKGNKCELNASPGFYFGSASDNIQPDARIRMTSYSLDNIESISMVAGDTLNYTLSYTNFGSDIAQDVLVTFPTTHYFRPIGSQSWSLDSLGMNDSTNIPVRLEFRGNGRTSGEQTYYSPSITWTSGETTYLREHRVLVDFQNTLTSIVQNDNLIPNKFELYQNYPNPFNPSTTIRYDLPKQAKVKLVVYDLLGREVATLVDKTKQAGKYNVTWNAKRFASGLYFCRIQAGDYSAVKKLLLLK